MTVDELLEVHRLAVDDAMRVANERDGFGSNMSRESREAGLRAVAAVVWDEGRRAGDRHGFAEALIRRGEQAELPDMANPYSN